MVCKERNASTCKRPSNKRNTTFSTQQQPQCIRLALIVNNNILCLTVGERNLKYIKSEIGYESLNQKTPFFSWKAPHNTPIIAAREEVNNITNQMAVLQYFFADLKLTRGIKKLWCTTTQKFARSANALQANNAQQYTEL